METTSGKSVTKWFWGPYAAFFVTNLLWIVLVLGTDVITNDTMNFLNAVQNSQLGSLLFAKIRLTDFFLLHVWATAIQYAVFSLVEYFAARAIHNKFFKKHQESLLARYLIEAVICAIVLVPPALFPQYYVGSL